MKTLRGALALISCFMLAVFAGAAPPNPVRLKGFTTTLSSGKPVFSTTYAQGFIIENLRTIGLIGVGGSAVVSITFIDGDGHTVNVGTSESVSLTITTTAKTLPFAMSGAGFAIPSGSQGAALRVISGTLAINRNGTKDATAGAGNGFAASTDAPSSTSPEVFQAGQVFIFGLFSHAQYVTLALTQPVSGTVVANQGTAGGSAWPVSVTTLPLPTNGAQETGGNLASLVSLVAGGLPATLDAGNLRVKVENTVTASISGSVATTVADGSNVALGATTDAAVGDAAGSANAHLRQIAKLLGATLVVSGSGTFTISGAVTGSGNFATTAADGSNVALGTTTDAAAGDVTATANAHLRQIAKLLNATLVVSGSGTFTISGATTTIDGGNVALGTTTDAAVGDATGTAIAHLRQIAKLLGANLTVNAGTGTFTIAGAVTTIDGGNVALGSTTDAAVGDATGTANAHLRQIAKSVGGTLTVSGSGTFTISGTVTASNTAGDVANASSDSGNPVKVGGVAQNAEPTAVTNGQRANLHTDLAGKLITLPFANPENFISGNLSSDLATTTSTALIAAGGAGVRSYINFIVITNMHASVDTRVDILDGATVLLSVFCVHGGGGFSGPLPTPLRGTANTAVNVQCGTTGAQVRACVVGYKGS